jgi:tetratricopeptide (TPR) repeat protein
MLNPNYSLIQDAKSHSKNGKPHEAIDIYFKVLDDDPSNMDIRESIGWELYNLAKPLKGNTNDEVMEIKKILTRYLKLNTPRPSLLHSAFLIVAKKIIEKDSFNVVMFLKMWGLENLRDDDFENRRSQETGKIYSSIAETVIKKAVKQAIREKDTYFLKKAYPYLDKLICIVEDPVWLELYKSRLMLILGKDEEAYSLAIKIVKSKIKDFWAWELLGDTQLGVDKETALSCYCKALIVSFDEKFIPKIRLKLEKLF